MPDSETCVHRTTPTYDGTHTSLYRPHCKPLAAAGPRSGIRADTATDTKRVIQDFLTRMRYRSPNTPPNAKLRAEVTASTLALDAGISPKLVAAMVDTGCTIAESTYPHVSYEHQLLISVFTTYVVFFDDMGGRQNVEALGRFGQRVTTHEAQGHPILARLVDQFKEMYAMYPPVGADSIVSATLTGIMSRYMELMSADTPVFPGALRYPSYMRLMAGYSTAFIFFSFPKGWRDPGDRSYLQIIPELVFLSDHINDILSSYKEALDCETDNYVHLRAAAAGKDPLTVLRDLCEETLDTIRRVDDITANDPALRQIWHNFLMGYTEFHFRAKRYRLDDLQLE
ncbi:terpenoid synthase [Lenzites betulinus]|nr:terpenoid synthase [Lenzites betulinus]